MSSMRSNGRKRLNSAKYVLALGIAGLVLAGCEEGQGPSFLKPSDGGTGTSGARSAKNVERDVEAPEVFAAKEAGLWDGRPSLGGVWAAHPDVAEPGRVIIRNETNGKFVIGALFRREIETPGPRLQISSDAAAALGMLAGAPTNLDVVALRREVVKEEVTEPVKIDAAPDVETTEIDPVAASAAAAIEKAADTAPKPRVTSGLAKPFLQIGIFSVEQNANNTATAMRQAGMVPTVKTFSSKGKSFWRVLVGPAQSAEERAALLKKIKQAGFTDAYAVTN